MKKKSYWILAAMLGMCLVGAFAVRTFAALTDKQQSLSDIKALWIFVQGLTAQTAKAGLTKEQIEAEVKSKLRKAGIRSISEEESLRLAGSPVVYVNISAFKRRQTSDFIFHVDVGLLQKVSLVRDPSIRSMSITWNKGRLVYCPEKGFVKFVRRSVRFLMDKFIEDYFAANVKPGASKESF